MALIYITGIAGAGKSEVYKQLKERGLEVYGTDEDMLAGFYNIDSGIRVDNPTDEGVSATAEWRKHHTWFLPRKTIEQLAEASINKRVFLCGVSSNEEEFLDLFDELFALVIDDDTLKDRINNRTNNSFGKSKSEIEQIKEWQASTQDYYARHDFIQIDATQPIEKVLETILEQT